jgi:hypothetical protein
MKDLNNFSNFFIFVCGIYFGGFTFLGYFDNGLINNYQMTTKNAITISREIKKALFFPTITKRRTFLGIFFLLLIVFLDTISDIFLRITSFYLLNIGKNKNDFVKKYFPSFVVSGLLCVGFVVMGAFEASDLDVQTRQIVNYLLFYFCCSGLIMHCWTIFFFPLLVGKISYTKLISITLLIYCLCMALAIIFVQKYASNFEISWFFSINTGIVAIIFVASFPLLFVLFNIIVGFLLGQLLAAISNLIFGFYKRLFDSSISDEIEALK